MKFNHKITFENESSKNELVEKYRDDLIEAVKEMETIDGWTDTYDVDRILMNMLTDMRLETIDNVFNKL